MAARRPSRTHRTLTRIGIVGLLAAMVAASCAAQPSKAASGFSGTRALADVRKLVAIGPRVAGTPGAAKARDYITEQLKAAGLAVQEQAFDASTPRGSVHMINLLAVIPGIPPPEAPSQVPVQRLIVAGHYDTKLFKEFTFVGANDGGSSAALLVELARALKPRAKTFRDALRPAAFALFADDAYEFDTSAVEKNLRANQGLGLGLLREIKPRLSGLATWTPESVTELLETFAREKSMPNAGGIAQPLRVALTGSSVSPGLGETMAVLGKESTLRRLDRCLSQ